MRFRITSILIALFVFVGIQSTVAQTDRATLEGTVKDATGAVVPGATVRITQVATGESQERSSNPRGYYLFPGLAIGAYAVTVSKPGFDTKAVDDIVLQVGETHTLDIPLAVGQVSEKVEVTAEVGPAERTSAAAASVIDSNQIADLPVNGRDWSGLTLLAPFAQDDGRWIAEVLDLPGVLAYGATEKEAVTAAQALALRVLA